MANLFSGLESLGLGNLSGVKLFDSKEKEKEQEKKMAVQHAEIKEEDLLFDKHFTCKVCDREFKSKMVRTGKVKLI